MSMALTYTSLDFPSKEIRIIEIQPAASFESPLHVTMRHHLLEDTKTQNLNYSALSYVWGGQSDSRVDLFVRYESPVTLALSMKGLSNSASDSDLDGPIPAFDPTTPGHASPPAQEFITTVGKKLGEAIRYLRCKSTVFTLWADDIRINQEDDLKKNQQVNMMYDINTSASMVIAWLGNPTDHPDSAFDTINSLSKEFEKSNFHNVPELNDWIEYGEEYELK